MGLDAVCVFLMLTNLALLGTSRLHAGIRVVALQGVALSGLPFLAPTSAGAGGAAALALLMVGMKGVVFPWLLGRSLRVAGVRREMDPLVGYSLSLGLGVVLLALAFWLAARLRGIGLGVSGPSLAAAFFMMFTGLLLLVGRRTALSQALGFLVLENGMYAFGLVAVGHIHWLVELGVLLDVLVAVFLMGIAIDHISRAFDHIDVDQLRELKG